jgi:hypothetical protein
MSLETQSPGQIRNLVELNPALDAGRFIARSLASNARRVELTRLGACELAAVSAPPRLSVTTLLPRATSFMSGLATRERRALAPVLSGLRAARMLLAAQATDPDHVAHILALYDPDIIWLSGEARPGANMTPPPYELKYDMAPWGADDASIFANARGAQALDAAFLAFDRSVRRRRDLGKIVNDVEDLVIGDGVAAVERDRYYSWAWTGPGTNASFLVPSIGAGRLRLTIFFFAAQTPVNAENIQLWVEGERTAARHFEGDMKIEADLPPLPAHCCLRVELRQARTVLTPDRSRQIGYALHKVAVERLS